MKGRNFNSGGTQAGAVLIVSLIMLLLMTIIGISAMQTNVLEEKMAGNLGDLNLAFEASESALREGEFWLDDLPPPRPDPVTSCSAPCEVVFKRGTILEPGIDPMNISTWGTPSVRSYTSSAPVPNVAAQPRYYVEHELFLKDSLNLGTQSDDTGRDLYRVTARGTGGSAAAQAILRTTYARRF